MGVERLSSREVIGRIYQALEGARLAGWLSLIAWMNSDTDKESESYAMTSMAPAMRAWVDSRKARGLRVNEATVLNSLFEATIDLPRDYFRRDKTGQLMLRVGELASRAVTHWNSLATNLIVNGASSQIYDGANFFSASHSEGDSGTQKNLLTAAEYPVLNVGTPAAPTPAEMADAILAVVNHFYGYLDDQGEPVNEDASEFLVMVPVNLAPAARAAVASNMLNDGNGSKDNPLKSQTDFKVSVATNPRLALGGVDFYAFRTDAASKALILQEEYATEASAKAEGSEYEHDTNHWQFGLKASRGAGYGLWNQAIKATLS